MWKSGLLPAIAAGLFWVGIAQAHFVWIERDSEGPARVYFGDWADDIREKTGGALTGSSHLRHSSARHSSRCLSSGGMIIWQSPSTALVTSDCSNPDCRRVTTPVQEGLPWLASR